MVECLPRVQGPELDLPYHIQPRMVAGLLFQHPGGRARESRLKVIMGCIVLRHMKPLTRYNSIFCFAFVCLSQSLFM